jgi:hypothetical protein
MQAPTTGMVVSSLVPWLLLVLVWIGWAALAVWGVLLLRRISRALEAISASVARMESQRHRL